jgi:hypothetical protein
MTRYERFWSAEPFPAPAPTAMTMFGRYTRSHTDQPIVATLLRSIQVAFASHESAFLSG